MNLNSISIGFIVCLIFTSCGKIDESDEFVRTAIPLLKRGDQQIEVLITNPFIIVDYFSEPLDPDGYEIVYGTSVDAMGKVIMLDASASSYTLNDLENGQSYYINVRTLKEGREPLESSVLTTVPGISPEAEIIHPFLSGHLERYSHSYDDQYVVYVKSGTKRIFYYAVDNQDIKWLDGDIFRGYWAKESLEVAYISDVVIDNRQYPKYGVIFDVETSLADTLFVLEPSDSNIFNIRFGPTDDEIVYMSNEGNSDERYYNVWTLDRLTNKKEKITNFEPDQFSIEYLSKVNTSGEMLISGYYERSETGQNIYLLNLKTGELTVMIETIWGEYYPSFSLDGKKIAFMSYRSGTEELWIYNKDKNSYQQVSDGKKWSIDRRSTELEWKGSDKLYITAYFDKESHAVSIQVE